MEPALSGGGEQFGQELGEGAGDHGWAHVVFATVWIDQEEVPGPEGLDTPVLLVHEMVVEPAQQRQVVRLGLTEIGPMVGMVRIARPRRRRTIEHPAAVVAGGEHLEQRIGNGSCLAPEVQNGAVGGVHQTMEPGVAGQATDRSGDTTMRPEPVSIVPTPSPEIRSAIGIAPITFGRRRLPGLAGVPSSPGRRPWHQRACRWSGRTGPR